MSKILIACGGTGGHLAPGIAVAEELQQRGHDCVLLISEKDVDSALIKKYGHLKFHRTPGRAFGGGVRSSLSSARSLAAGFIDTRNMLREHAPDLVLLFGGFLSVGLGLAARLAHVPVVLHEANCKPGKATRLLKHFATRIYLPDGVKIKGVGARQTRYLGYPVRKEIQHILKSEAWQLLDIEVPCLLYTSDAADE